MKFTVDTENKTITIDQEIPLNEIVLFLEKFDDFTDWKIVPKVVVEERHIHYDFSNPHIYPSTPIPYFQTITG